jgi:antitoxin FitA
MVAQRQARKMATGSLTIRDIPRPVLAKLRALATENRRSMQGEILAILEAAAADTTRMSLTQLYQYGQSLGLKTPSDSARMIREDRDGR